MKKKIRPIKKLLLAGVLSVSAAAVTGAVALPIAGVAIEDVQAATSYTLDATPVSLQEYPGIYKAKAKVGDDKGTATIGIPSVAKQNLNGKPTTESPAIITGAAVNYETKTGPTEFTPIPGAELKAPYSYFRWSVIDEQITDADGNVNTHKKLSGFDGSYYIIRVDVSDIIKDIDNPDGKYLHVKQTDNKALMVALGINGTTFADALGSKTGSYSLANNAAALKDTTGNDKDTPYIDVIVMSSGKNVAGADTGAQNAPTADISLSFYVDDVEDYNPDLKYDATSTDPNHAAEVLKKFFNDEKCTAENNSSSYLVKGSDLEIDVMVDETENSDGVAQFTSLTDAFYYQPFNAHTVKLICEVPVLDGIDIQGTVDNKREVILDVNSFDIQFANHSQTYAASLLVGANTEFTVKDGSNTAGAELAMGNNSLMLIQDGGVFIIDETCSIEAEYDAPTTVDPSQPAQDLSMGLMMVSNGGKVINRGVVNLEGKEAKPLNPNAQEQQQGQQTTTDMKVSKIILGEGSEFHNYGALSIKGEFEIQQGTLYNYGKYDDIISKGDPDKGTIDYHRGIQLTWKDDVRNTEVVPGNLMIGLLDKDGNPIVDASTAVLDNTGDIVLCPGNIDNYGTINNHDGGKIYLNDAKEAVVPITPTAENPTKAEERVTIDPPKKSFIHLTEDSKVNTAETDVRAAEVAVKSNGVLGALTPGGPAQLEASDIKATDHIVGARDVLGNILDPETDIRLKDGAVEFTSHYTDTFTGDRQVEINIGYRYYVTTVKGTQPAEDTYIGTWANRDNANNHMIISKNSTGGFDVTTIVPESDTQATVWKFSGNYDYANKRLGFDTSEKITSTIDADGNITEGNPEAAAGGALVYKDGVFFLNINDAPADQEPIQFTKLTSDYNINVTTPTNGAIIMDKEKAFPGEHVVVNVVPAQDYATHNVFVHDKDGNEVALTRISDTVYTFYMPEGDAEISATFVDYGGVYDITTADSNFGTVTADKQSAVPGDTVTITTTPNDGFAANKVFVHDKDGNEVAVTKTADNTYTFIMPESHVDVSATFVDAGGEYAVKTTEAELGTITVDKSSAFNGDTVTITIQPNDGYAVHNVSVHDKDGNEVQIVRTADNTFTFTMPKSDVDVSATFVDYGGMYDITTGVNEFGTVTTDKESAAPGEVVTITTAPNYGYAASKVVVHDKDGNEVAVTNTADNTYTFVMPESNVDVSATFVDYGGVYDIKTAASNFGSVTTDKQSAVPGDTVTITTVPNEGFAASKVFVFDKDGNEVAVTKTADNTYTFVMPESNADVKATFVNSGGSYIVKAAAAEHGTVTVDKTDAAPGDVVSITVSADEGFATKNVSVLDKDGKEVAVEKVKDNLYIFTMPDSDVTISATFVDSGKVTPTEPTQPTDPTEPAQPTDPTKPTDPTVKPEDPTVKPANSGKSSGTDAKKAVPANNTGAVTKASSAAKTGDNSNVTVWTVVAATSAGVAATAYFVRRRKANR